MVDESNIHKSRARILVVDDEPQAAEALRDLLVFQGFDVETAEDGKEAIDLLASNCHFDLMITDMRMPGMNGLELLKRIRQFRQNLPAIVLTGDPTVENGIHSIEEGACDYVLKPFNTERLMWSVARGLSKSRPDL